MSGATCGEYAHITGAFESPSRRSSRCSVNVYRRVLTARANVDDGSGIAGGEYTLSPGRTPRAGVMNERALRARRRQSLPWRRFGARMPATSTQSTRLSHDSRFIR